MPYQKRPFDVEALELAAEREALEIRVFLAGPYIKVDEKRPRKNKNNHALLLRYDLYKKLGENDFPVSLGEYRELLDAYRNVLNDLHNATLAEKAHAERKVDAVVLLPSSPGSFSELGTFSMSEKIAKKMLILINKKYECIENYINLGPTIFARGYGSEVVYCSYENFDECFEIVDSFLDKIRDRKMRDKLAKL